MSASAAPSTTPAFALTAWQVVVGGALIFIGWIMLEGFDVLQPGVEALSWRGIVGTLYASTIPMIFRHWGWTRVLQIFSASVAAIGTLLIGESIGATEMASLGMIITALTITLAPRLPGRGAR